MLLEELSEYQTFHASFFSPKGFFNIIVRLVDHFDHLPVDAPDAASGVCGLRDGVGLNVSFSSGVVFVWFDFLTHFFGYMPLGWLFSLDWVELFVQDVMDWADWALECNNYDALQVLRVLLGAFLLGSSCLFAF